MYIYACTYTYKPLCFRGMLKGKVFTGSILIYKIDSMEKFNISSCFQCGKEFGLPFQSSCVAPELIGIINVQQFGKHLFYFHNGER